VNLHPKLVRYKLTSRACMSNQLQYESPELAKVDKVYRLLAVLSSGSPCFYHIPGDENSQASVPCLLTSEGRCGKVFCGGKAPTTETLKSECFFYHFCALRTADDREQELV